MLERKLTFNLNEILFYDAAFYPTVSTFDRGISQPSSRGRSEGVTAATFSSLRFQHPRKDSLVNRTGSLSSVQQEIARQRRLHVGSNRSDDLR